MDRPILFSGPMVRALLDGRKTQTRRVLGKTGRCNIFEHGVWSDDYVMDPGNAEWRARYIPISVGDRMWVREAHYLTDDGDTEHAVCVVDGDVVSDHLAKVERLKHSHPLVDWSRHARKRPGIHMPRWASRLTLTVTDVRVQRLQDLSEEDAIAEGAAQYASSTKLFRAFDPELKGSYRDGFFALWDAINGPESTDANPWVAAYTFTVERRNIDEGRVKLADATPKGSQP